MSAHIDDLIIRHASDADSPALIALIGKVYAEYPGCILDVENEMPELLAPATAARAEGGRWWVAEVGGKVVASGAAMLVDGAIELKRLYVSAASRKRGLGAYLVNLAENEARWRDLSRVFLWTDTRFADAHRLYERLGYTRTAETRTLNDKSNSVEYHYAKDLQP